MPTITPDRANDVEALLAQLSIPRQANFNFEIDGVPFQASHTPSPKGVELTIWAILGNLPFSAENPQRRRLLTTILYNASELSTAKFGLDKQQRMIVTSKFELAEIKPPEFIFPSLIGFIQQAMPFIQLIGKAL